MKRYGFLFEKAFTRENLYEAFVDASKDKLGKRSCFDFERRLAYNLDRLYESIHNNTYKPQPYYEFKVYEPKERKIFAPSFMDLVVQHAVYRVIYKIYNDTFIDQSFACRKGKGTHKAADFAQYAIQRAPRNSYILKMDISKFFYQIDRGLLRKMLERRVKDKRFVDFMMKFTEYGGEVGIPIGNLLSQTFALIYLNPLDHFIKRNIKARYYCRYVDDFIIFGETRAFCVNALEKVKYFVQSIKLKLSKFSLSRVTRGLNFVGYRT